MRSGYQAVLSLRAPIGARQSSPCHCGAGVRWTPLRSRSTDRAAGETAVRCAAIRSLLKEELRILSCSALRMTYRLAIATIVECAASRRLVIAKVRVSGGHLCKAEAPTEPAGEICKRLWQSVPFQGEYGFFHASRSE